MRPSRRFVRSATWLLLATVAVWWLSGLFTISRLTRRAAPPFPEPVPAVAWAQFEQLRLTTPDGEEIGAWFSEGEPGKPAVLVLHGNQGSRTAILARLRPLIERGMTVLAPSLRAHGDSSGDKNDFGYSAQGDVVACVRFLAERVPERPIVVQGFSLGTAAAVFAAAELGTDVAGYVLEAPYADLSTAAWNRVRMFLPPPVDAVAWGALRAAQFVLLDAAAISPVRAIEGVPSTVPVLIMVGSEDRHATPDEARALHARLGPNGHLVVFPGGGHERLPSVDPELYWRSFDALLERVVSPLSQ